MGRRDHIRSTANQMAEKAVSIYPISSQSMILHDLVRLVPDMASVYLVYELLMLHRSERPISISSLIISSESPSRK